ncbi:hypothetical protein QIX46_17810 [Lysinibacillus boronitolerans]|nr:hypothetical protein QIX46_17810 [Lysinibacillus boronitolerans]
MQFKFTAVLLLVIVFIVGCSSQDSDVTEEINIDVSDYFPLIGLERTYIEYGNTGQEEIYNDIVIQEYDKEGNEVIYIHGYGGLIGESVLEYSVTEKEIRLIYRINSLLNKEVNELELSSNKEWFTGDGDDSKSIITGRDLTVKTKAGTFNDVLEVTKIKDSSEPKIVKYYAPKVGVIKTVYLLSSEDEHVYSELESTNLDILLGSVDKNKIETNDEKEEIKQQEIIDSKIYVDNRYGFKFQLPFEQSENIKSNYDTWNEKVILKFTYIKEDVEQSLFSIIIDDEVIEQSNWENPMDVYLGNNGVYTFSLSIVPEPSISLIESGDENILEYVQSIMENMYIVTDSFEMK